METERREATGVMEALISFLHAIDGDDLPGRGDPRELWKKLTKAIEDLEERAETVRAEVERRELAS